MNSSLARNTPRVCQNNRWRRRLARSGSADWQSAVSQDAILQSFGSWEARSTADTLPICNRRYGRLPICATLCGYTADRNERGEYGEAGVRMCCGRHRHSLRRVAGRDGLVARATQNRWRIAFFISFLVLVLRTSSQAQEVGAVSGVVVSSWDGAPLSSVTITVRGTTLAAQTGADGRYQLNNVPPGDQVLRFSKSGFASAVVTDVRVLLGQTSTVNGNLRPEFYEMEEYEVTAEVFTQQSEQILFERQQAASLMDAIGSEQFSKLGAGDAGQIVSRVTGVSVVGGKYAVVRGLSDRYTRTLLNGVEVPSADPYRMSPQLDLFPSAMIDRIAISKTFTPDQPGGTGGGTIDIITKSFPEKPFLKVTLGNSYNSNSSLKNNFLSDPSSSMGPLAIPSGPNQLNPTSFGLTEAPGRPGPAGSRETAASAESRRQQANAAAGLLQELGTANFAGVSGSSPLNSSLVSSAGKTVPLFGRNLGMFGGINYSRDFRLIEDGLVNRYNYNDSPHRLGRETRSNIATDYGANVNLGYDLSEFAQLGFNFMLAHSTDEEARHGSFNFNEGQEESLERWQLHFTDREILNYQLHGRHDLPFLAKSKVDWVVALASTTQNEPDHRFMNYFVDADGRPTFGDASTPFPQYPARYFREIEEQALNYRVDWTWPLPFMKEESKLKTGFFSSSTDRGFREQYFAYDLSSGFDLNNPNTYLNNPAYLEYAATYLGNAAAAGRTNYNFARYVRDTFAHPYTASQDIRAGYLMADIGVLPWLRLIGGARLESTLTKLDAGRDGTAKIDQSDLLPAASAVVTMWTNLNLRLSYGETVARPSFREIAPVLSYLPDLGITALGNPNLQMIAIKSYDARVEWFPNPGDILSLGFFHKEVEQPIELTSRSADDEQVIWINRANQPATLMGVEFEARKSLEFIAPPFKGLTLGANVTLIQSTATLNDAELANKRSATSSASDTRPLFDQSPYIINLDLNYEHPTSGTSYVIGANLTGERLVLVKTLGADIYEHPPVSLDAAISQKFWKRWTARFAVRNILDPDYRQTYGSDFTGNIFQNYKRGRTFSVSLSAEF
jgi:outer membrane receptor protein involved in Fe transport